MGVNYRTVVGIFIKVPIKREITQVPTLVDNKGKPTSKIFNPDTGEKNPIKIVEEKITTMPKEYPNLWDSLNEDTFVFPEYLPKSDDYSIGLINYDDDYEFEYDGYVSLNNLNVKETIYQFKVKHKDYLDYFTKEFGEVEVLYGVAHYGS